MSFPALDPTYCRLTVLAPRSRVNVALPADLAVAELVPMVLDLVGEPASGARPQPWRLSRATGAALAAGGTLRELGVLDGDLLRIAPDGSAPPPPVFDDPVDALAATAGSGGPDGRGFGPIAALLLGCAAAIVLAGWPTRPAAAALLDGLRTAAEPASSRTVPVLVGALAAAAALGYAGWLTRRPVPAPDPAEPDAAERWTERWTDPEGSNLPETIPGRPPPSRSRSDTAPAVSEPLPTDSPHLPSGGRRSPVHNLPAATAAAVAGVALAAVAAWVALPDAAVPVRLLLMAAAAGVTAGAAQVAVRAVVPVLIGVLAAVLPIGIASLSVARLAVPPTTAAIGAGAAALVAGPLLPRAALWLAGVPRPVVPADAAELVTADHGPDLLPAAELAERAAVARGYLAGLVGGCAVVAAAAAGPAATATGWAGPALAAVTAALLGLRARSYADPLPFRSLATGALVAGLGLAVVLAWSGAPWSRPAAAVGLLLVAAAVLSGTVRRRAAGSPVRRRTVDLAEGALTAAVVPLALAAMELFTLVRGW